jgi:hypothetical protein
VPVVVQRERQVSDDPEVKHVGAIDDLGIGRIDLDPRCVWPGQVTLDPLHFVPSRAVACEGGHCEVDGNSNIAHEDGKYTVAANMIYLAQPAGLEAMRVL